MISVRGFVLHYFTACAVFTDGAAFASAAFAIVDSNSCGQFIDLARL
jgi:hypothetical protein